MRLFIALLTFLIILLESAVGQVPPDTFVVLEGIEVEAARSFEVEHLAPFSVFTFRREADDRALTSGRSLQDVAAEIPGLWLADRGHLALGERIVLRGASSRAPWGTRGIQLIYDGIPLTTPDGQTMTEIVDPLFIEGIEVIRGPSSTFWGNASAGTLYFTTAAPEERASLRMQTGSFGDLVLGAQGQFAGDEWQTDASLSHVAHEGFRDHSTGAISRGSVRARHDLTPETHLQIVGAAVFQDVESPGALTFDEWQNDPSMANPSYVQTSSGKESSQGQVGFTLQHGEGRSVWEASAYGVVRDLLNPLPYAVVDLSRNLTGGRIGYSHRTDGFQLSAGIDGAVQSDGRLNFENVDGAPDGDPFLDQQEQVVSVGGVVYGSYHLMDGLRASAGLRGDHISYSLEDRVFAENDLSGSRSFSAVSPSAGLSLQTGSLLNYVAVASSFETPTTTELVSRPDFGGGFNPDLRPERAWSLEAGTRGFANRSLQIDLSAFLMRIDNRLLPFQTEEGGDRQFFRNAETSEQQGLEVFVVWSAADWARLTASGSFLRATFVADDGSENDLPGVPEQHSFVEARFTPAWWMISARVENASSYYADDANEVEVGGFTTADVTLGYRNLQFAGARVLPFVQFSNIFDVQYTRSAVINASFGRYFEPSPGRRFAAGVTVRY